MPGASQAVPLTPNGEPSARVIASIAFTSPSSGMTSVASASGLGASLIVASVRTPSVPCAPQLSLVRSRPVTFFITRPPQRIVSARPLTSLKPSTPSRTAPALGRRGPARLVATIPPSVGSSPQSQSGPGRIGSNGNIWPCSAIAASIASILVPAFAQSVISAGA